MKVHSRAHRWSLSKSMDLLNALSGSAGGCTYERLGLRDAIDCISSWEEGDVAGVRPISLFLVIVETLREFHSL